MRSKRYLLLVAVAMVGLGAGLLAGSATSVAAKQDKTAVFDLFGNKQVKPKKIFLTANSGQYLKQLEWFNWGTNKTTGVGTLVSDCASCPKPKKRPAIVRFSKKAKCKKKGGTAYKQGKLTTGASYTGEQKSIALGTGYSIYCK